MAFPMQTWQEKLDVQPVAVAQRSNGVHGREEWQFGADMVVRFWDSDEAQPAISPTTEKHAAPLPERQVFWGPPTYDSA